MESLCKRMAVSISLNIFIMKLTMFSISFSIRSACKMDYDIDNDNHMGSLWKHMVVTITLTVFQMRLNMFLISFP